MQRELKPELLDSLPSDHPDALHNRRDLRLINRALGGHRWLARTLTQLLPPSKPVLEVGAGTGELGDLLAARGFATAGLDLWPKPAGWPSCRAWHRADLLTFDSYSSYPVIIGNLIFHQFTAGQLAALGENCAALPGSFSPVNRYAGASRSFCSPRSPPFSAPIMLACMTPMSASQPAFLAMNFRKCSD